MNEEPTQTHGPLLSTAPTDLHQQPPGLTKVSRLYGSIRNWWPIVLIGTALVSVLAKDGIPREVAKWHVAQALENYDTGDLIGALRSLTRATQWDPSARNMFSEYSIREGESFIEQFPKHPSGYMQRGFAYQFKGRGDEAIADGKIAVELGKRAFGGALNALAYLQALNNKELDQALVNIELAIQLEGTNTVMIDTRGFIRFRRQEYASARIDLDDAIKHVEKQYQEVKEKTENKNLSSSERAKASILKKALESHLAVSLYHRSLTLKALDLIQEAEEDLKRIRELGVEPSDQSF